MKKYISHSLENTKKIATQFAQNLKGGDVVGLVGNLGGGKTTFTQFAGCSLGIKQNINSPTFVLLKKYQTNKNFELIHVDLYRAETYDDAISAGVEEYLGKPGFVCLIEWADKIPEIVDKLNKKVIFNYVDENSREIKGDI